MLWYAIQALAAQQHGLITTAQAYSLGASEDWLRWAVREGRLRRVRQGVYVVAGSASEHQAQMAACLAGGRSAALSHLAAASLWGAEQVKAGQLEITTFGKSQHRLPGISTHRSSLDPARAITHYRDLPIVVPPLAVVQLAETCHPYLVKSVANDLVKRHWTNFAQILEWVDAMGDRRRQALRELCLRAIDVGGHDDSPPARTLCWKLKRAGAEPFETDYPVDTPGGLVLVDIAWPRRKYGIEYNGARDHETPLAAVDDARRHAWLAAAGWRVFDAHRGFTYDEVVQLALAALALPGP